MVAGFQFIQTLPELKSITKQLDGEEILAVDVEADSLYHYLPKVCLVQISTNQHTFVIDTLAVQKMDPLRPLFASHKIKKVFHGADYDIRSLFRDYAIRVNHVFDTMIASQFLGEKEVDLAAILKKRFGVILNKKYQRANWSKRPLSHEMLFYAAHDTAYLLRLYRELERELKSKGRLGWVEEECNRLSIECTLGGKVRLSCVPAKGQNHCSSPDHPMSTRTEPENTPLFKRFKGAGKMAPRDLAILENLLLFRERRAVQQDRPPFKVFGNHVIKELVTTKPTDYVALREIPGLPADFMKRYARGALKAIQRGLALPADRLPSFAKAKRPPQNPKKQARLKRLKAWRELKASQLEIQPGLVCNNALLDTLAEANPKDVDGLKAIAGMKTWQRDSFGQELVNVLHGRL
ncbi:MAG: HRDC domain-containing protein [Deltaproteobacteria bacterium]|nr:HRDC domain-containing protein [Deltaproteobacteria bacterium]MBW2020852.1 HRDC domain-containing protein [Deltaproteobacteria bacterium]MBW2075291.1 HRDC domain-containing protein [Deltaproteobacteria bacterium]